jgi:hypothetical protein
LLKKPKQTISHAMSEAPGVSATVREQDVVCALLHRPSPSSGAGAFEVLVTLVSTSDPLSTLQH